MSKQYTNHKLYAFIEEHNEYLSSSDSDYASMHTEMINN